MTIVAAVYIICRQTSVGPEQILKSEQLTPDGQVWSGGGGQDDAAH